MTGRYSHHTKVVRNDGRPFDNDETIAVWLDRAGYRTGFVGKYLNVIHAREGQEWMAPGWDYWVDMMQHGYYGYRLNDNGRVVDMGFKPRDYLTDVFTRKSVSFIRSGGDEPFFLWVAYRSPHKPTTPAPRHKDAFPRLRPRLGPSFNERDVADKPRWVRRLRLQDRSKMRQAWVQEARALLSVDDSVKRIMRALQEEGELDRTVIMFLSDNGYARGHHRWSGKVCPYDECLRVPYLIRYPGATQRSILPFVSNVDVATTIADMAKAQPTLEQNGKSLVPFLENESPQWRNEVLLVWRDGELKIPPYWGIRTGRWKYVRYGTGEEELYDLRGDPHELSNRAADPSLQKVVDRLWERIRELRD